MGLRLTIDGASLEDIQRGIAAAEAVFKASGVSAQEAAGGMFALEVWDDAGCQGDFTAKQPEDARAAGVWMDAGEAAVAACCTGWPEDRMPLMLSLEYVDDRPN